MYAWLQSWFYAPVLSGPARNAPCAGIDIKKFIEEKAPEVNIITQNDIVEAKRNLVHVEPKNTFTPYTSPLIAEFNTVFEMGYKNFFEKKKSRSDIKL